MMLCLLLWRCAHGAVNAMVVDWGDNLRGNGNAQVAARHDCA